MGKHPEDEDSLSDRTKKKIYSFIEKYLWALFTSNPYDAQFGQKVKSKLL